MHCNVSMYDHQPPHVKPGPLELPDWRGKLPHRSSVSNDQWLDYCRSNLPKLRQHPGHAQQRRQNGIALEFVL